MLPVSYECGSAVKPAELADFYRRLQLAAPAAEKLGALIKNSAAIVIARADGQLIGMARGVTDGVRGYLTECKLDPLYQGPGAVTRKDGRIEHDSYGIAAELARRVIDRLRAAGAGQIDVVAWGTEVDFLEELGFKRHGGLVGLSLRTEANAPAAAGSVA
jgi:ribosomal protein S18 acetylase RimI-like enzyme